MENLSPLRGKPSTSNKARPMSFVDAFSPEMTATYARKMVERETRGNGDQMNALERVGRRCGMTARSLRRLINGEVKDPGVSVFSKVLTAYLDYCARQITELQHEIEIAKMRSGRDDTFEDFDAEVEALAARVERAKKGLR